MNSEQTVITAYLIIMQILFLITGEYPLFILFLIWTTTYILSTELAGFSWGNKIDAGRTRRRKEALQQAKIYLGHYSDIWKNLRLSNSRCYLNLGSDGTTITGFEKDPCGACLRTFTVLRSTVHNSEEIWNMFCKNFSYNKSYDGLKEDCRLYKLVIEEKISEPFAKINNIKEQEKKEFPLVDINNASEKDLIALPGISAIMAKKAIKRREECGGFKTIEEFFAYLKIKPNMQENLISLITIKDMQGYKKVDKYQERNIDL